MAYPNFYQQEWIRDAISSSVEERVATLEDTLTSGAYATYIADKNAWKAANTDWKERYIDPYMMRRCQVVVTAHIDANTGSLDGNTVGNWIGITAITIPAMRIGDWPGAIDDNATVPAYPATDVDSNTISYFHRSMNIIDNQNGTSHVVGTWVGLTDWTLVKVGTVPST